MIATMSGVLILLKGFPCGMNLYFSSFLFSLLLKIDYFLT